MIEKYDLLDFNANNIKVQNFRGTKIFRIKNFYKNPKTLKEWILSKDFEYHKKNELGYNGIYFNDRRHVIDTPNMKNLCVFLSTLCERSCKNDSKIVTNYFNFKNHPYNNFKNNYWHPHLDAGYTAIIYLQGSGTNLYETFDEEEKIKVDLINEHLDPWKSKKKWKKIYHFGGRFNELVLFNANNFYHGADISSLLHTKTDRLNQVIFFN